MNAHASFSYSLLMGAMQFARCLQAPLFGKGGGEAFPLLTMQRYCIALTLFDSVQETAKDFA
jgi:hypothetical protein